MEPYFNTDLVSLYQGDFLCGEFPIVDGSVDFIFADPPYLLSNGGTTVQSGNRVCVNKGTWDKSCGNPQLDFEFHAKWIDKCKSKLKSNGCLAISGTYHSIYYCGAYLLLNNWRILNDVVWYKPNAAPNIGCRSFTHSHETVLLATPNHDSKYVFNYSVMKEYNTEKDVFKNDNKQMRDLWSIPTTGKSEKQFGKYPTQKPIELMKRFILASTVAGDTILDPFCGSCSTGVAALLVGGRKFIGIDNNTEALDLSINRLKSASNNSLV
jgi:site-specific DNA-methyltransferase (adenine-specific)